MTAYSASSDTNASEYHIWCNVCLAPVPVSSITHKTDFPSVGDLTHWHNHNDQSHCITDEPGDDNVDHENLKCLNTNGIHFCERPRGHYGKHVCFMAPTACEDKGWD